jgi:hypothetical protein
LLSVFSLALLAVYYYHTMEGSEEFAKLTIGAMRSVFLLGLSFWGCSQIATDKACICRIE